MKKLNEISTPTLLLRIARVYNVPVQNVYIEKVTAVAVSGFYDKDGEEFEFWLSYERYHRVAPKAEMMTTGENEQDDARDARRRWLAKIVVICAVVDAVVMVVWYVLIK